MKVNYETIEPGMAIRTKDNLFLVVATDLRIRNIMEQSITVYDTQFNFLKPVDLFEWQREGNIWNHEPIVEVIPAEQVEFHLVDSGIKSKQTGPDIDMKNGKNFKLVNQLALWHDLYNPAIGKKMPIRIYSEFDLLVDASVRQSPEDYWLVMPDLDGESFAQPISGHMLADKLMTGGFLPLNQVISKRE